MLNMDVVRKVRAFMDGADFECDGSVRVAPSLVSSQMQLSRPPPIPPPIASQSVLSPIAPSLIAPQVDPSQQVQPRSNGSAQPHVCNKRSRSFGRSSADSVWETYLGDVSESLCPLCACNRVIKNDRSTWEMSHIHAHAAGGSSDLSNIRPICFTCNRTMGSKHLRTYVIERYPERYYAILRALKLRS